MTTLIGWFGKQGESNCVHLVADGRLTSSDKKAPLIDTYPKIFALNANYYVQKDNVIEKNRSLSLGVGFSGSTLAATATLATFRQICESLLGPPDLAPSLNNLAILLNEIHWYHRSSSAIAPSLSCEFLITGHCPASGEAQLYSLKQLQENSPLEVVRCMPSEICILGADLTAVRALIADSQGEFPVNMGPMFVLNQLCQSGGTDLTGGSLSIGYLNPSFKEFFTYLIIDYKFDKNGNLLGNNTINGFDVEKIKELIPGFYVFGPGFSPFVFKDRIIELNNKFKSEME